MSGTVEARLDNTGTARTCFTEVSDDDMFLFSVNKPLHRLPGPERAAPHLSKTLGNMLVVLTQCIHQSDFFFFWPFVLIHFFCAVTLHWDTPPLSERSGQSKVFIITQTTTLGFTFTLPSQDSQISQSIKFMISYSMLLYAAAELMSNACPVELIFFTMHRDHPHLLLHSTKVSL